MKPVVHSLIAGALMLATGIPCWAKEECREGRAVKTPAGDLVVTSCRNEERRPTRKFVSLSGTKLLEASYLSEQDFDESRGRWIFRDDSSAATGCPDHLFLVDLTLTPPKVLAFGVKGACNEFHWASWGNKRSVIALKHDVKFIYEDGKLTLPEKGTVLWKAIEPPHAGEGLGEEDAIPFGQEMLRPK